MLRAEELTRSYERGAVHALRNVTFAVAPGECVALMGPSGSGKSTLLHLLGALDQATSGQLWIDDRQIQDLGPLPNFRARNVGFVFQFHHLIRGMTLRENVEAPMVPLGIPRAERRERAEHLLDRVGLGDRARFLPSRVSGGERQRCAIARALVNYPRLVLADEPTGQLDEGTGNRVMDYLMEWCAGGGITLVLATHNSELGRRLPRCLRLRDGTLESDGST